MQEGHMSNAILRKVSMHGPTSSFYYDWTPLHEANCCLEVLVPLLGINLTIPTMLNFLVVDPFTYCRTSS